MPRTSGTTPYWVRRESGGGTTAPTARLLMVLTLSGTGSVRQNGSGGLTMSLVMAGTGVVRQSGSGVLAMSLTLSGTGSVVTPTVLPAKPVITHIRRRVR